MKNIDFSKIAVSFQYGLILNILKNHPQCTSAEIAEISKLIGVTRFSYESITKLLYAMVNSNWIEKKESVYMITKTGQHELESIVSNSKAAVALLENTPMNCQNNNHSHSLSSEYLSAVGVKTVPYTVEKLDCEEEDFFLEFVPNSGDIYDFDGRGLGVGNFSNYIISFQNNNLIKYVAVLDYYTNLPGEKTMHLKKGTIHKLTTPISNLDMQIVQKNFRFIRNKQTLIDPDKVSAFKTLLEKHW